MQLYTVKENISTSCYSVVKLCLTLCDPMDYSIPGSSVLHYLLKFAQIYVHLSWWCCLTIPSFALPSFAFCLCQHQSFPMSLLFASGDKKYWSSASATVLPMNIQGWFPLGFDWFDLLAVQGTLKSFLQQPQSESIDSSALSLLYGPTITSVDDYGRNHSFDCMDLYWQRHISAFFNMLSRFVIAFLPRSKPLLISWLQSPSTVILEPKKIKLLFPLFSLLFAMKWWDWMSWF